MVNRQLTHNKKTVNEWQSNMVKWVHIVVMINDEGEVGKWAMQYVQDSQAILVNFIHCNRMLSWEVCIWVTNQREKHWKCDKMYCKRTETQQVFNTNFPDHYSKVIRHANELM